MALFGTVIVRDGVAVCQRLDGRIAATDGKHWTFDGAFGGLHPRDEGKQIHRFAFGYQMENDEQRARRLART